MVEEQDSIVKSGLDHLVTLKARGKRLAKLWKADGTVASYDDAKLFTRNELTVRGLAELSAALTTLQAEPCAGVIRGRLRGGADLVATDADLDEAKDERAVALRGGFVRKGNHYFEDQPLHSLCVDVDKFAPMLCDPIEDPGEAILEFIYTQLPPAFHGAGYHWQLSGSAGHPSKVGLNVHLWFWLSAPRTSAELKAWANATGVRVDKALFSPTQWHYTAAPVFERGVTDPIEVRSGLVDGPPVVLEIDEALAAHARDAAARPKAVHHDPIPGGEHFGNWLRAKWTCGDEHADGELEVECVNQAHHSPGGAEWAGYHPTKGYHCFHANCGHLDIFKFKAMTGYDAETVPDEFDAVEQTDDPEQAAVRAKNADKLPPLRLESDVERERRIEREKSRAIGEGAAVLPVQGVMSGSEMLEDLVFLSEGSRVSRVSDPRFVLTFGDFRATTEASATFVKSPSGRKMKRANAQLWLEHPERKTVRTQTFAPGRPALCMSPDHVPAQNLWAPRAGAAPASWRELSAPFFEHVEYLVPVAAERERFLDWLAHIEQRPGELPSTHYLMVASQTGIGRNWLAYALARAFPGHTALGFDLAAALKSGFNGSLSMKLLAVVDELHEGGPGGAHTAAAERLKSMLTEATRLINPKHGRQHTEFNCSRFLMFSNHAAALPLADNDRRVIVIENPSERRSEAYFRALYALLDDPAFGPALAEALRQRDIAGFNAGAPAPMSEAKARTIRAGRSEVEQAIRDVAREWPSACITSSRLTLAVGEALGGKTWNTQSACVAAGLVKYEGRHRVAGLQSHIWVLRDPAEWRFADPRAVVAETERGLAADTAGDFA